MAARAAQLGGVEGPAEPLQALVAAGQLEPLVELLAARDGRGLGACVRREADAPLDPLASAQRQVNKDPTECSRTASPPRSAAQPDFSNGLLGQPLQVCAGPLGVRRARTLGRCPPPAQVA